MTVTELDTLRRPTAGDDVNHYGRTADIVEALATGGPVTALCGVRRHPLVPAPDRPLCAECERIAGGLQ